LRVKIIDLFISATSQELSVQQIIWDRSNHTARGAACFLHLLLISFLGIFGRGPHVIESLGCIHLLSYFSYFCVDSAPSNWVSCLFYIVFKDVLGVKHQIGVALWACSLHFLIGSIKPVVRVDASEFLYLALTVV